jgi:hypothetical protein
MRKGNIFYLIWLLGTIGVIYAIVQYGNRLQAPAALPKLWTLQVNPTCPLMSANETTMTLKQSGETLELFLLQAQPMSLHGKLKRDGSFRFSGETRNSALGCGRGKLLWEGKASHDAIEGAFVISGAHCKICPGPIRIVGRPQMAK